MIIINETEGHPFWGGFSIGLILGDENSANFAYTLKDFATFLTRVSTVSPTASISFKIRSSVTF